jgi:hypothetical protein
MKVKMYHEHKPFKCPNCGKLTTSLNVHDIYDTESGDGIYEVFTPCCDKEVRLDDLEETGFLDNKGWKFD